MKKGIILLHSPTLNNINVIDMKTYRIGIIGAGHIARKMAHTLANMEGVERYAIASRDIAKSENFAKEWGFSHAYGSYEELANDPVVDLIYIATPHAMHYEQARMCILKGKPVLCEKAFTANARQAEELLKLAQEKRVFIAEAIWTRYMPLSQKITELVQSEIIGKPFLLTANLGYVIRDKERLIKPELAGGALLDVGVYPLNFAAMIFGTEVKNTSTSCIKTESGVDAQDSITQFYSADRMAILSCSMYAQTDRLGIISGDKGCIIVENINNPQSVKVIDNNYRLIAEYQAPKQITGFEYEISAAIEAIENGWVESPYMPHAETIRIMKQMDALREEWEVKYPFE
ncbi:oxidoreductase [Bacteroides faecalis]|uniref:Oxidoreductase n=2 Tax=Bacteroides faecalis TaxID=2447885 RepID=A0A401LY62_9BACE|nr:oxidoreductase [Bacteroides faecalis]